MLKSVYLYSNEYSFPCVVEGVLLKQTSRRLTERYIFLFDTMIILTKQNTKRSSVTGPVGEYKLKEKFHMRRVELVLDREDEEQQDYKFSFELRIKEHPPLIFVCKNQEDKNSWMAALVSLLSRSMLERMLDAALSEEEKNQPLRLPAPDQYRCVLQYLTKNLDLGLVYAIHVLTLCMVDHS